MDYKKKYLKYKLKYLTAKKLFKGGATNQKSTSEQRKACRMYYTNKNNGEAPQCDKGTSTITEWINLLETADENHIEKYNKIVKGTNNFCIKNADGTDSDKCGVGERWADDWRRHIFSEKAEFTDPQFKELKTNAKN